MNFSTSYGVWIVVMAVKAPVEESTNPAQRTPVAQLHRTMAFLLVFFMVLFKDFLMISVPLLSFTKWLVGFFVLRIVPRSPELMFSF